MKVTSKSANKIWKSYFGYEKQSKDPFGVVMYKNMYGLTKKGGWEVDHIWPMNSIDGSRGANTYGNIQPLSFLSNDEKKNKLQGKIENVAFAIHKIKTLEDGTKVGRMTIKINEKWYWAYNEINY